MILPIIHETEQIILTDLQIVDMIMPIYIKDKQVVLEEHLAQKEKLNVKYIK